MRKFFVLMLFSIFMISSIASTVNAQWFLFQNPLLGKAAADFTLPNLKGDDQTLETLREDDAAIVFFWATWCPHCRKNLTLLSKNAEAIKEHGIRVILVDLGETSDDVKKYLDRNGIEFDVLLDQYGEVAGDYGVQGIPTFIYVSKEGIVKAVEHELLDDYEEVLLGD